MRHFGVKSILSYENTCVKSWNFPIRTSLALPSRQHVTHLSVLHKIYLSVCGSIYLQHRFSNGCYVGSAKKWLVESTSFLPGEPRHGRLLGDTRPTAPTGLGDLPNWVILCKTKWQIIIHWEPHTDSFKILQKKQIWLIWFLKFWNQKGNKIFFTLQTFSFGFFFPPSLHTWSRGRCVRCFQ